MITKTKEEYITDYQWLKDSIGGQNLILREESSLLYLQLFNGYLYENKIAVYAQQHGEHKNMEYHIVERFDDIDYFIKDNVMCSTFNQAVNDMLSNFEITDTEALAQALANYYHLNNTSFAGLSIKPENMANFEYMVDWAMEYYNDF